MRRRSKQAAAKALRSGKSKSEAMWGVKRRQTYTETGIKRLDCIRCGNQASVQWQICSDGNNYRPICSDCDLALNILVLEFFGHPDADLLIDRYKKGSNQ